LSAGPTGAPRCPGAPDEGSNQQAVGCSQLNVASRIGGGCPYTHRPMKMHPIARLARVSIGVPEAHMAICVGSRHEQEVAPWLQAIGEGVDDQQSWSS
jgi:hypothetical protein